jgi:hypothetical protein
VSFRGTVARFLPVRLIAPRMQRRAWTWRTTTSDVDHLALYWNSDDTERRLALIQVIVANLKGHAGNVSVLEFGSHVGVNLKLLAENRALKSPRLFAVEPNYEAVGFMKAKLPQVSVLRGDHRDYLRSQDFPPSAVTLSFANAVLYSMGPRAARRVVRKMLATSAVVVIGDNLDNSRGSRSTFQVEHLSFAHPFEKWIRAAGVSEITEVPLDEKDFAIGGFLIAVTNVESPAQ